MIRYLKFAWAFPVTFFGLIYSVLFWKLGWHKFRGVHGDALVWVVDDSKAPGWLMSLWKGWAGHAIGNVIVMRSEDYAEGSTLVHEQKHVDQVMRLGVFQPIVYAINMLAIKVGCVGSDPYYSNPFEIDARRAAGQLVDVEGALKKLKEKAKSAK